jgi:hypothetical protein
MIATFRGLAVLGTGINFLMQYHAIVSLSNTRVVWFFQAAGDWDQAEKWQSKAEKSDKLIARCEPILRGISAAYLGEALILSFLVYPPS